MWLRLEGIKIAGYVVFHVAEQDTEATERLQMSMVRCCEIRFVSQLHPDWSPGCNKLFLRGELCSRDHDLLVCTAAEWQQIGAGIHEFNHPTEASPEPISDVPERVVAE